MKLLGMLDSPYVRRVAIAMRVWGMEFDHHPISVFRGYQQFAAVNPVVKAPTLVTDDGTMIMDSTLILDYLSQLNANQRPLLPSSLAERAAALSYLGIVLAVTEKAVQIVYEQHLRPTEKQHGPWLDRIQGQWRAGLDLMEQCLINQPLSCREDSITLTGISTAVCWSFIQGKLGTLVTPADYPVLHRYSQQAEQLPVFLSTPAD